MSLAAANGISHELFEAHGSGWLHNGRPASFDDLLNTLSRGSASLLHVHGTGEPPRRLLRGLTIPWICDHRMKLPRSLFRPVPTPAVVLADRELPEAVSDDWFVVRHVSDGRAGARRVGSFARNDRARNNSEQSSGRIRRFREDVEWILFDAPPTPDELAALDLWVDPASSEDDVDGMVPEALACLTPVVAAKTERNSKRLDGGKAGLLPPVGDHNEMTHAVLNVLFKEEVAAPLRRHARLVRERFRPANRRAAIEAVYAEVIG